MTSSWFCSLICHCSNGNGRGCRYHFRLRSSVKPNSVDGNFFTFTGMHDLVEAQPHATFKVLKSSLAEFPLSMGRAFPTPCYNTWAALSTPCTHIPA
ncbi:hypothetical protein Acr_28g0009210 [Actinidia rufa]|uniref:Uncharacterized protein n=1 Tax=Actinidia rufa TaxID=165716 RepID=A0A7J0HAW0_9ERIC|nr:hypothetical protein Acr_28g0009210 [Actinidia rufa]